MQRFLSVIMLLIMSFIALYATPADAAKNETLPLPRFASIRAKKANLHVGPGTEYPSEWTYVRPGLPVEIIAEFDTWRQVRDPQGGQGWLHKSMICGKRTVIIQTKQRRLYKEPNCETKVAAILDPGVMARVITCQKDWCQLDVKGHRGWVKRRFIWGVYPNESTFK